MVDIRVGDEVLAPWGSDAFLYPAIVVALQDANAQLAYLDGDEGVAPLASLRRSCFSVGMTISVNWKGKGTYYRGVIAWRIGSAMYLHYEDGDKGWTTLGQCRVPAAVIEAIPPEQAACSFCGAPVHASAPHCGQCGGPRLGRG